MLPPGHIAGGYLTTKLLLNLTNPELNTSQIDQLLLAGCFFAFAPDLDMFYAFWKEKSFRHTGQNFTHRQFITHIPLVWLIIGLSISLLAKNQFMQYFGLIVWLSSWSHFVLDCGTFGIRWLYPFSKKFYALKSPGVHEVNSTKGFINHWYNLVKLYYQKDKLTSSLEIILIFIAILIFII